MLSGMNKKYQLRGVDI